MSKLGRLGVALAAVTLPTIMTNCGHDVTVDTFNVYLREDIFGECKYSALQASGPTVTTAGGGAKSRATFLQLAFHNECSSPRNSRVWVGFTGRFVLANCVAADRSFEVSVGRSEVMTCSSGCGKFDVRVSTGGPILGAGAAKVCDVEGSFVPKSLSGDIEIEPPR